MGARHNFLALFEFSTLTLASGVVTATQTLHTIAAQTGTTDDLDTITVGHTDLTVGGTTVRPFIVIRADTGDTITVKHGTGNISLASEGDFLLEGDKLNKLARCSGIVYLRWFNSRGNDGCWGRGW
jgi:hypothetical protein